MQPGFDYIGVNVVFICHDDEGNILMHLRSEACRDEHNTWDYGGGKVEFGETLEEAARREIREEYGCEVRHLTYLNTDTIFREHEGRKSHWVVSVFVAHVDPREIRIGSPEDMIELGWYQPSRLPEPLHSGAARWFRDCRSEIDAAITKHIE
ncbi:MAG: NUDIX domain-containing protein [Patescibacteria group bacterium]